MSVGCERCEGITWSPQARVLKWHPETVERIAAHHGIGVDEVGAEHLDGFAHDDEAEFHGNILVTTGLARLTSLFTGAGGQAFNNAQGIIGVGSTSTGPVIGDTHLGGDGSTTTAYYQGLDATYPTTSNGLMTAYATFASGNANFAWNEWCWAVGTGTITPGGTLASVATSPILINHKAAASLLGTKVSGSVWQLQSTITLS